MELEEDLEFENDKREKSSKFSDPVVYDNIIMKRRVIIKVMRVGEQLFYYVFVSNALKQIIPINWKDNNYTYALDIFDSSHYIITDPYTEEVLVVRSYTYKDREQRNEEKRQFFHNLNEWWEWQKETIGKQGKILSGNRKFVQEKKLVVRV